MKMLSYLALGLGLFALAPAYAQRQTPKVPTFITDSLDRYVEEAMRTWQVPGLALAIVKDGRVILSKGYGLRALGKPERVDEHTLFAIGSNTKAFVGTALGLLEADGQCTLDDPVKKWLPAFRMKDPWVERHATLTDLLTHRLGVETFQGDFLWFESNLSNAELIDKFGRLKPPYEFRTRFGYCNFGYLLAGEAISAIARKPWQTVIRERLLTPLGMDRTVIRLSELERMDNRSAAHTFVQDTMQAVPYAKDSNEGFAAGGMFSSARDLSRWMLAQLDSGRIDGRSVLPMDVLEKTRYPQLFVGKPYYGDGKPYPTHYGLGWNVTDFGGKSLVHHGGAITGFLSSVSLLPEERLGIAVLTNTDQSFLEDAIRLQILHAFQGVPFQNYSQAMHRFFTQMNQEAKQQETRLRDSVRYHPPLPLPVRAYTGQYTNEVYGSVNLTAAGPSSLKLTFEHHPELIGTLDYLGNNRFLCTYNHPSLGVKVFPFVMGPGGVRSFTLSVHELIEFTPYTFTRQTAPVPTRSAPAGAGRRLARQSRQASE